MLPRATDDDDWLAALPAVAEQVLSEWELEPTGEDFPQGDMAYSVSCVCSDGEAVLKIDPNHEFARRESVALRAWGGRGAVSLLRFRTLTAGGALLTERIRPGALYVPEEDPDASLLVTLLEDLRTAPCQRLALPDSSEQLADILTMVVPIAARFGLGTEHRRMETLAASLSRLAGPSQILIHGDLAPSNLLFDDAGRLRAIDPFGYVGPQERELGEAAVHNRTSRPLDGSVAALARCLGSSAEATIGYARIAAWTSGLINRHFASRGRPTDHERLVEFALRQ